MFRQGKAVAIVPAAGQGKRFGPAKNKAFQFLGDKPLILWSLEVLQAIPEVLEIIPVLRLEDAEHAQRLFDQYGITKIKRIAPGGKERQDSVYSGLRLIEDDGCFVIVHDGARPFVDREVIEGLIREMEISTDSCDGIVLGVPVKDTIKEAALGFVTRTLHRADLWAIQTPQVFTFERISRAYEMAMASKQYTTDDAALIELHGGKIKIVRGSYRNIKITTPEDLVIAEALLKVNQKE